MTMGNLCFKFSNDAFVGQGRVVDGARFEDPRASAPFRPQNRPLGGQPQRDDPRTAAARAAEVRLQRGKLA